MKARDLLRLAMSNLRENPLRTALCALSVAVGTGALLVIAVLGLFGQTQLQAALRTIGVSGLTVYLDDHGAGNPLSAELADALGQAVSGIDSIMPIKAKTGTVRAGHTTENAVFLGADDSLGDVMQLDLLAGSLLTAQQADAAEPVAVVGDTLPAGVGSVSYTNANDGTCEGIDYPDLRAFTVQFHPEACTGPKDTGFLFDRFVDLMKGGDR